MIQLTLAEHLVVQIHHATKCQPQKNKLLPTSDKKTEVVEENMENQGRRKQAEIFNTSYFAQSESNIEQPLPKQDYEALPGIRHMANHLLKIKNLNLKILEIFTKVEFFTHNSLKMSKNRVLFKDCRVAILDCCIKVVVQFWNLMNSQELNFLGLLVF